MWQVRGKRSREAAKKNNVFWAFEKKCEGVRNGCSELLPREINANHSGKNSRGFNDSHMMYGKLMMI